MDNYYNDIALFRFSLIAPIINKTYENGTQKDYLNFVVGKTHYFRGKEIKISYTTIKRWRRNYEKYGLEGLRDKKRKDKKSTRKFNYETEERILSLRESFPRITGTAIWKKLIEEKYIDKTVSKDIVLRYIRSNNLKAGQVCTIERRMFEMEQVNECWQADTSVGPYIKIEGVKYKTYIIMFIDDKSRMVVGYDIFFNDNAVNMQKVFKQAVKTYGRPKKLFVDNGGPYDNKQLTYICAELGVKLIHAKVYSPESKAKQERLFRTIKDGWMRCTDWNEFKELKDVKASLEEFIIKYSNQKHSVTKATPNDRWHAEYENVVMLEEERINRSFLHKTSLTVRKDRTVKFNNEYYEVPYKYVCQKITVKYDPEDLETLYLYDEEEVIEIKKVDKVSNGKIKRSNQIDYSKMLNDETDAIEKGEKNVSELL